MNTKTTWRDYLTDEERAIIQAGDDAKAAWERLNAPRAGIINRCNQRSRYAARKREREETT